MKPETSIVYGPLWTRRFGWDLGINLSPLDHKLCTFDCIYCQYGFTPPRSGNRYIFPSSLQIILEWSEHLEACAAQGMDVRHTTFSGNGEPTMHPFFPRVARQIAAWRNENAPLVKLALFTNGFRLHDARIREALNYFDEPIIKFDSASPEEIYAINRPRFVFDAFTFVEDLKKSPNIILQTMFLKGWNDSPPDLRRWRIALEKIQPREVQIYTLERAPAFPHLRKLKEETLYQIAEETSQLTGIPVQAFV
jgi:wyosine [tRNA(Phe)-imidazoG37] synthetase (radical SAM superfamily)